MPQSKLPALRTTFKALGAGLKTAYEYLGLSIFSSLLWFICHIPLIMVLWTTLANLSIALPERGQAVYLGENNGSPAIYYVEDGGKARVVPTVRLEGLRDPALSPDGKSIAFAAAGGLYLTTLDGKDPRSLTEPGVYADPAFSPDGALLVFAKTEPDGASHLYLYDLAAGKIGQLTKGPVKDRDPSFAPDGKRIVFARPDKDGGYELFTLAVNGSDLKQITETSAAAPNTEPLYALDGRKIVFLSRAEGKTEIFMIAADGRERVRLTDNSYDERDLAFSQSGGRLLFTADDKGKPTIFAVSISGGPERPLLRKAERGEIYFYLLVCALGVLVFGSFLAGPANAAMIHAAQMLRENEGRVRDFLVGFKRYYLRAAAVYASYVLAITFLAGNIAAALTMGSWLGTLSLVLTGYVGIFVLMMSMYFPPLLVLQNNTFRKVWKKAFLLTLDNGLLTLCFALAMAVLSAFAGVTLLLLAVFFPAVQAVASCHLFTTILDRYEEPAEAEVSAG